MEDKQHMLIIKNTTSSLSPLGPLSGSFTLKNHEVVYRDMSPVRKRYRVSTPFWGKC